MPEVHRLVERVAIVGERVAPDRHQANHPQDTEATPFHGAPRNAQGHHPRRACERRSVPRYAFLASPEDLAANDFNLNIPRYVDASEPAQEVDLATLQEERSTLKADLFMLEEKMAGILKELGH